MNIRTGFAAGFFVLLAACGGGGSNDAAQSNNAQQSTAPATPAASVSQASTCYLANVNPAKPCVVDDWTVQRARINAGDGKLAVKLQQMKAGGVYNICFTGGSITVGEKVWPDIQKAWAFKTFMWFAQTFPQSQFHYYNEAVSGTNSIVSQTRVTKLFDAIKCDMTFVDYAVNDYAYMLSEPVQESQAYASILDQAIANGGVQVVLETMYPNCTNAESTQVSIAMQRNLLVLSEKSAICGEIQAGTLLQADWNADGTHPNAYGHELLTQLVTRNLAKLIPAS